MENVLAVALIALIVTFSVCATGMSFWVSLRLFARNDSRNTVGKSLLICIGFAIVSNLNVGALPATFVLVLQVLIVAAYYEISKPYAALAVILAGVLGYVAHYAVSFIILKSVIVAVGAMLLTLFATFLAYRWERQQFLALRKGPPKKSRPRAEPAVAPTSISKPKQSSRSPAPTSQRSNFTALYKTPASTSAACPIELDLEAPEPSILK